MLASIPGLGRRTTKSIRQQLKLSAQEFRDLVNCPMTGHDYEELIREKIGRGQI
jgi:hypothetical protein